MSWRQFVRAVEADARRQRRAAERVAVQRYRELQRQEREAERMRVLQAKEAERLRAINEASRFENYLELIVSLHKDCGDVWDWQAVANVAQPNPPARTNARESAATVALQTYRPGFFEKLFGGDKKRVAGLTAAIGHARMADESDYAQAVSQYQQAYGHWSERRALAARILVGDATAYPTALSQAAAFDEISAFQSRVTVVSSTPDAIVLVCEITDPELVPNEEVKLTAAGKLSTKAMAIGRYWALYQDHVCSCAIRVARETFAVLPVSRVIVNIGVEQLNTSTGHRELNAVLAVHFARQTLTALNLDQIDPSDAMQNFPHRMKFKKTAGLEPVQPMTADEQWVST